MSFYMNFGTINEGQQAEEYKKRKAEEKDAQEVSENERSDKRNRRMPTNDPKRRKACKIIEKEFNSRMNATNSNPEDDKASQNYKNFRFDGSADDKRKYSNRVNAISRHIRRHPEAYKEFGIFAEACFINE